MTAVLAGFERAAIVMSDEVCCIAAEHLAGYSMLGSLMKPRINSRSIESATPPRLIALPSRVDQGEMPESCRLAPGVSFLIRNSCITVLTTRSPVLNANPSNTRFAPRFDGG